MIVGADGTLTVMMRAYRPTVAIAVSADYRMTVCEIPYRWRAEKISVPLGNRNLFFVLLKIQHSNSA